MLIVKGVMYVVIAWGWLLLVTSMVCCHDNGNVGLHMCAKFHDHTYTQCFMLIVKG